jgi:hypothetical protein
MVQFKTVKGDSFSLDLPETATVRASVTRAWMSLLHTWSPVPLRHLSWLRLAASRKTLLRGTNVLRMLLQIDDVKSQIEQARGPAFPKDGMTLIFNGKVLSVIKAPVYV